MRGERGVLSSLNHFPGEESRRVLSSWAVMARHLAVGHTAKASPPTWDPGVEQGLSDLAGGRGHVELVKFHMRESTSRESTFHLGIWHKLKKPLRIFSIISYPRDDLANSRLHCLFIPLLKYQAQCILVLTL